jgi:hypothetical protein
MRVFGRILTTGLLALFIAGIALTADQISPGPVSRVELAGGDAAQIEPQAALNQASGSRATYDCALKVYMVEQESRWKDATGKRFENALLSFAFDTTLSLAYEETFSQTKTYDISATGWVVNTPDSIFVREDNMKAIAVLFNSAVSGVGDSDPYAPVAPFNIHYVDASAAAMSGSPGWDTAVGTSTHTMFVEEASTHT